MACETERENWLSVHNERMAATDDRRAAQDTMQAAKDEQDAAKEVLDSAMADFTAKKDAYDQSVVAYTEANATEDALVEAERQAHDAYMNCLTQ